MSIITLCKVNVFLEVKNHIYQFWFLHNYEKKHEIPFFFIYKLSNPIVNGIIFSGPNNIRYLVPS